MNVSQRNAQCCCLTTRLNVLYSAPWFQSLTLPPSGTGFISEVPAVQAPPGCLLHCCQGKLEMKDWNVSTKVLFFLSNQQSFQMKKNYDYRNGN